MHEFRNPETDPHSWANLEKVARAYIDYWERTAPGAYEAFEARMASATPARGKG